MPEQPRVAVLVPNLFLAVPVDAAIRGAGAVPVPIAPGQTPPTGCRAAVVDLDALGADAAGSVRALVESGLAVVATGPHVRVEVLAACRAAGALVLPRSAFLARLPELLALTLRSE